MTRVLYQGFEGLPDHSEQIKAQSSGTAPSCPLSPDPGSSELAGGADELHEECGVVAIHGHPDAARQAYLGLYALQHRGQESAGIATADGQFLANIKGMGLVSEIFTDDVLQKLPGDMAIGHTRYSTTGDSALLNAQPIRVESTKGLIAIAHNGNLVNLGTVRAKLERAGAYFQTTSDSEIIVQLIAHSHAGTLVDAIAESLSQVDGAFSIVMMTRDRVFAARDPRGFRPLSMGRIHNPGGRDTIVFASETCAFDLLRAEYERDVLPGELVMVTEDGVTSRQYSSGVEQTSCIFEHVYFARPDSRIYGRWVQESRDQMGRQLARESHVPSDVIVPVPDSGVTAALGYAEEAGVPFRLGLIRNHYVGRTFIEPEQRVRDFGVKLKLNPVRNLLEGKRVILIDDSIIRGTTSRKIVRMVRGAGAKEVHLRISCPPTISPCFYGVDTPSKRDLIAANKTIDEIREFIEADSLAYLSLDGLQRACGSTPGANTGYCVACYTGNYPTQWVDVEDILPAAANV
ncbi:amidophosphoribosyltransferase [Occallatibacter riparius]|uniref:Amidophosphoribosyltransferase n=1 Tax=Occallatibacter riparius TaxID=1002689 RepID=A0A9J7BTP5_9BACT|nr:amidophosphoribosyltransferase [Occallatibacter riparius]UWZ84365.1 amidophosphoribosyltransferase [Occallatibacter riparius]